MQYLKIRTFPFQNQILHRLKARPIQTQIDHNRHERTYLTRSAIFATSIIELISFRHSINVIRRFRPETTVTGPRISVSRCLVKFLIKHFINKLLPTFAGPTKATTTGGGSSGVRSTSGRCIRFSLISWLLYIYTRVKSFSIDWKTQVRLITVEILVEL